MKIFFGVLLYFLIGTIVAGVRLFIYNVDLTEFSSFNNDDCADDQIATMLIIVGWPIYSLLKVALIIPKAIVFIIKKFVKGETNDQG